MDTFEHNGNTFCVEIEPDDFQGPPWEREDGHVPVREVSRNYYGRTRKAPGEMLLGDYLVYDYAEACRIARRDGWGCLPGELHTREMVDGSWIARAGDLEAHGTDANEAIRALYDAYRATFPSDRAYAAAAAMSDFKRLDAWCRDVWCYVGVVVTLCDENGDPVDGMDASLWGIESDAGDYLDEVARELAEEIIAKHESGFRAASM